MLKRPITYDCFVVNSALKFSFEGPSPNWNKIKNMEVVCVYVCVKLSLQHNVQITQYALHNSAAEDTNSYSSHNVHSSTADHISSLLGFTKCVRSINNSISTKHSRQSGVAIET